MTTSSAMLNRPWRIAAEQGIGNIRISSASREGLGPERTCPDIRAASRPPAETRRNSRLLICDARSLVLFRPNCFFCQAQEGLWRKRTTQLTCPARTRYRTERNRKHSKNAVAPAGSAFYSVFRCNGAIAIFQQSPQSLALHSDRIDNRRGHVTMHIHHASPARPLAAAGRTPNCLAQTIFHWNQQFERENDMNKVLGKVAVITVATSTTRRYLASLGTLGIFEGGGSKFQSESACKLSQGIERDRGMNRMRRQALVGRQQNTDVQRCFQQCARDVVSSWI
jgi:hypothetical protein